MERSIYGVCVQKPGICLNKRCTVLACTPTRYGTRKERSRLWFHFLLSLHIMYTPTDALQVLIFVFPVQPSSRVLRVQTARVTAEGVMSIRTSPFTLADTIS